MSHGFLPAVSRWSPFHGAVWAHVQAAARLAAVGADHRRVRFTLQEYFGKPMDDPRRWGQPSAALLGALHAELALGTPAIGGKDSMSGTFMDLDVPPTLVAFAVGVVRADQVTSPEFKGSGHPVVLVDLPRTRGAPARLGGPGHRPSRGWRRWCARAGSWRPRPWAWTASPRPCRSWPSATAWASTWSPGKPGDWFAPRPGAFVLELAGRTRTRPSTGSGLDAAWAPPPGTGGSGLAPRSWTWPRWMAAWEAPLEPIFPTRLERRGARRCRPSPRCRPRPPRAPAVKVARPRVVLTVFPGTNCEYDTAQAFERAGAVTETVVFRNLDARRRWRHPWTPWPGPSAGPRS